MREGESRSEHREGERSNKGKGEREGRDNREKESMTEWKMRRVRIESENREGKD